MMRKKTSGICLQETFCTYINSFYLHPGHVPGCRIKLKKREQWNIEVSGKKNDFEVNFCISTPLIQENIFNQRLDNG
jgi:hypothetical protein